MFDFRCQMPGKKKYSKRAKATLNERPYNYCPGWNAMTSGWIVIALQLVVRAISPLKRFAFVS
jgi:hypothetical protein